MRSLARDASEHAPEGALGDVARQAAARLDSTGRYLQQFEPQPRPRGVLAFVRERPLLVAVGVVAVVVLLLRKLLGGGSKA
jgi:hypothetical protein